VTLVAPTAHPSSVALASEGSIEWQPREYEPADLDGSFLSSPRPTTARSISQYTSSRGRAMLVNVVDVPPLCNFILPAMSAGSARDRDLDRRRLAGAGEADEARDRGESSARSTRGWL
jgi:siroheme synthase (precorrin-2 oxidase/ferrochelatase)